MEPASLEAADYRNKGEPLEIDYGWRACMTLNHVRTAFCIEHMVGAHRSTSDKGQKNRRRMFPRRKISGSFSPAFSSPYPFHLFRQKQDHMLPVENDLLGR